MCCLERKNANATTVQYRFSQMGPAVAAFGARQAPRVNVALAGFIVPGDFYASDSESNVVEQYSPSGAEIGSYTLPSAYGTGTCGIAEGASGLMYVVTGTSDGAVGVVAINTNKVVEQTYSGPGVLNNLACGEIAFGTNGDFYVSRR